ncbi:MAG: TetR/AcrR family transcriptional regulator [Candidatus Nanopelagicales bacterium]
MSTARRTRPALDADRICRAGVALADRDGIDALTMRALAKDLGVEAMSLYYHVPNKERLLDGMVDVVVAEIALPDVHGDWRAETRRRAVSAHEMLTRHPWAAALMESRTTPGPAALRYYDAMVGCLLNAGFPMVLTAHALSAIDAYVYGFGLQQMSLPFEGEEDIAEVAESVMAQFPVGDFPYLARMITEHALQPGYRYADEFAFGLDLILDGFERLRADA